METDNSVRVTRASRWASFGALLAALGVCASCCLLPVLLVASGAGGMWLSTFDSLARFKWMFAALAAPLLAYGFYALYWKPKKTCIAGASCSTCRPRKSTQLILWLATMLAVSSIAYDYIEAHLAG